MPYPVMFSILDASQNISPEFLVLTIMEYGSMYN